MSDKLKEQYKEIFGKYPHHKAKEDSIIKQIAEAGHTPVLTESESEQTGVVLEKGSEYVETKIKQAEEVAQAEVIEEAAELPLKQGKMFLVYFKEEVRYWSKGSIEVMLKSHSSDIKIPEGSPYQTAAINSRCKNC